MHDDGCRQITKGNLSDSGDQIQINHFKTKWKRNKV